MLRKNATRRGLPSSGGSVCDCRNHRHQHQGHIYDIKEGSTSDGDEAAGRST
jgi:hypothetical protein